MFRLLGEDWNWAWGACYFPMPSVSLKYITCCQSCTYLKELERKKAFGTEQLLLECLLLWHCSNQKLEMIDALRSSQTRNALATVHETS